MSSVTANGRTRSSARSWRHLARSESAAGCLEIRKAGGREQDASYEITEHDPPHKTAFRGVAGPVRPVGTVTVEPVEGGSKSRVSIDFDLVGYGFGKLIAPLARMQARKAIATSQKQLKAKLEVGV